MNDKDIEQRMYEMMRYAVEGDAKAGISVFGAKVNAGENSKTENASRLTFSIPIVYPSTHIKSPTEQMMEKRPKRPQMSQTGQDIPST